MLRDALARNRAVPTGHVLLSELYADMQADYRAKSQNVADLAKRWKHLELVFGSDAVHAITTDRIRRYIDLRLKDEAAPATVQLEIACLRRMLRLGFNATPRKIAEMPAIPTLRPSNTRTGFFERADFEKVRRALPDYLRPLVTIAYWTGLRRGELIGMTWEQVDFDRGTVRLLAGHTKTREGRIVFLPPEALLVLRDWRRVTAALERREGIAVAHVFHRDGQPIGFDFYEPWRAACEKAGFPGRLLHDFRRTAARNYVRQGVSEHVAMKILGHKTRSIFDRYNIVSEADLAEAAARVSAPILSPSPRGAGRSRAGKRPKKRKQ